MIKINKKTTTALVSKSSDLNNPFIKEINLLNFSLVNGKQYDSINKVYLVKILYQPTISQVLIDSIHYVNLGITKVIKGTKIIWELISSCFGSGFWKEDANWSETETWKE